jgi:hypothetical protein
MALTTDQFNVADAGENKTPGVAENDSKIGGRTTSLNASACRWITLSAMMSS